MNQSVYKIEKNSKKGFEIQFEKNKEENAIPAKWLISQLLMFCSLIDKKWGYTRMKNLK